jgi:hypothetical protein
MSNDITTINDLINKAHDSKLAEVPGMVYQIWSDGEITLQKSGNLLWNRSLHTIAFGSLNAKLVETLGIKFPETYNNNYYAFVSHEDANKIRKMLIEIVSKV